MSFVFRIEGGEREREGGGGGGGRETGTTRHTGREEGDREGVGGAV